MIDLFRPSQPSSPSGTTPPVHRQSPRFSVPVLDVPIRVEVLAGGIRYPAKLWDVSQHGACLLLRSPIPPNQSALLRIHAPTGGEKLDLPAQLMWLDSVMGAYYAGVRFAQGVDFSPTFLGTLIRNSDTFSRASDLSVVA
jgi:hypothetical protein